MQTAFNLARSGRCSAIELCPEFFSSPEYFSGDFELPTWSHNDPHEFVYTHRKLLESPQVSAELPRWIDLTFGITAHGKGGTSVGNIFDLSDDPTVAGSLPQTLFVQPHARRKVNAGKVAAAALAVSTDRRNLVFACVTEVRDGGIAFASVTACGRAMWTRIDFVSGATVSQTVAGDLPVIDVMFAGCSAGFVALERRPSLLYLGKEKSIVSEPLARTGFERLASGGKTVVLSDRNGQLFALDVASFPAFRSISCVTNDYICALAVNHRSSVVAAGTCDGHVSVSSIIDGAFRFSCDVGEAPAHIEITDGWGFIVVHAGLKLFLFNVNGRLIRSVECSYAVQCIATWKMADGCDFCAIADGGQVRVFEALFMRLDEFVCPVRAAVVAMRYVAPQRALAVVAADGEVLLISFQR
jgi:hypothetical protein